MEGFAGQSCVETEGSVEVWKVLRDSHVWRRKVLCMEGFAGQSCVETEGSVEVWKVLRDCRRYSRDGRFP
jgi:hypothetical protein